MISSTGHRTVAPGDRLPISRSERSDLRRLMAIVRSLSKPDPLRSLAAIACDWAVLVGAFVIALQFPHPAVWIPALVVIAARQHALLLLMHDAAHFRLFPSQGLNDRLANWALAYPILISTQTYRANHLSHHAYTNTDRDPDWVRKSGRSDWTFPTSTGALISLLVRDLIGFGVFAQLVSIYRLSGLHAKVRFAEKAERILYGAVVAGLLAASGHAFEILGLWFGSALFVLPVILRIRSIAEHFGVESTHEMNKSRNYAGPAWERFFFAPHNAAYHLDHHLFPSVPFHNLPRLHRLLERQVRYRNLAHQNSALFPSFPKSVMDDLIAIPAHDNALSRASLSR